MTTHAAMTLPELLSLRGPARTAGDLAQARRQEAKKLIADASRLFFEAEELEALARAHKPEEPK